MVFLAGCSAIPGLAEPRVSLAPHVVLLDIEGDTNMQSRSGGPIINNPEMNLDAFAATDRNSEFGGSVRIGDGFSGITIDFLDIDNSTSANGFLTNDWGDLRAGDTVNTEIEGYEFRIRYIAQFFEHSFETDNEDVRVQVGAGPGFATRKIEFKVTESSQTRRQNINAQDDGVLYIASRAKVSYSGFAAVADYQISPSFNFGGDFDDTLWDLELLGTYTFEDQDLTVYAGWRRSELPASGREGDFEYDLDLTFDGWILGLEFTF